MKKLLTLIFLSLVACGKNGGSNSSPYYPFVGTFQSASDTSIGNFCLHDTGVWVCDIDPVTPPAACIGVTRFGGIWIQSLTSIQASSPPQPIVSTMMDNAMSVTLTNSGQTIGLEWMHPNTTDLRNVIVSFAPGCSEQYWKIK